MLLSDLLSKPEWRSWSWQSWSVIAATLIGCQSIVASGVIRPRLLALADAAPLPLSADGGIDAMGWLDPDQQEAVSICKAFDQRRRGERLRLHAVASYSRLRAGQAPSSQATAGLIE